MYCGQERRLVAPVNCAVHITPHFIVNLMHLPELVGVLLKPEELVAAVPTVQVHALLPLILQLHALLPLLLKVNHPGQVALSV